ncbi:hypothetical protein REPUB_Repub12eG0041700 [Reevesia pubescens]
MVSKVMWRNIAKHAISRRAHSFQCFPRAYSVLGVSQGSVFHEKSKFGSLKFEFLSGNSGFLDMGGRRIREVLGNEQYIGKPSFGVWRNEIGCSGLCPKGHASVAEAVSSTDVEEDVSVVEEIKELMLRSRQVKIETEAWTQAVNEYRELLTDMCEHKLAPNLPYMKSLFLGWFEPFRDAITKEQELSRLGKLRAGYASYLDQLPADMAAVITMHKLMGLLMTGGEHGGTRVVQAACLIGDAIEQEVGIHKFLEKTKKKRVDKENEDEGEGEESDAGNKEQERLRKKVTNLIKKQKLAAVRQIVKGQDDTKPWGQDAKAKVGSHLIELLMKTAYIQPPADELGDCPPDVRPAFVHSFNTVFKEDKKTGRRYGVVECDPLVRKGLEKTARHMVIPCMPMLVPPVKWTGYERGAYLFLPSYIMRTHGAKQQREAVKRTPRKQLEQVFEALVTLGHTKWRVNKRVLSVVDRIWASGGHLAVMVDHNDVPLPEEPDTEDEALLRKWKWKVRSVKKENRERHSQRCDIELKLVFAEGRPLGRPGLRWLKIHLANLYAGGVDKLSHEGQLAFTENHLDDIFDSADRSLEGKRWWLKAEDPFQCLAVCINLTDALRSSSPGTFVSHIPVHQDGSCNGLQHYAALGRDKQTGILVYWLCNPGKPKQLKGHRVLDIMRRDAQKDPTVFPDALRAKVLVNQVDRKLVKQTVMTSVYGVTYIGARDQIKRRLKERGVITDEKELFGASCYAAKTTLTALGEMFQAARAIMSWLGECANIIASENQPVSWTTPLGLPVVQPYRVFGRHFIKTSLQVLTLQRETGKIMVKRQRTAFPPNFVHSLDGSHMMMTAVASKKAGLTFAGYLEKNLLNSMKHQYWRICWKAFSSLSLHCLFLPYLKGEILIPETCWNHPISSTDLMSWASPHLRG